MQVAPLARALILTIGYGEGHRAAARSFVEHWERRGGSSYLHDPFEESSLNFLYQWTRQYYRFCVKHASFLWALTYRQTETAELSDFVRSPLFIPALRHLKLLIEEKKPDFAVCTYPIYGYLLDYLKERDGVELPYLMLVTDAIAMSKPWLRSQATWWSVLDEHSQRIAIDRFALPDSRVCVAAFPVSARFFPQQSAPTVVSESALRILYAANAPLAQVKAEILALVGTFPLLQLTVLGGTRFKELQSFLHHECSHVQENVTLHEYRDDMDVLFREHDLYIGKAGAATVFEAYQSALPLIINFALPGQEEGNLELIERDGVGLHTTSAPDLVHAIRRLLRDGGRLYQLMRQRMMDSPRRNGANRLIDFLHNAIST